MIPLPPRLQPRAAVAYMLVSVVEVAAHLERSARACGPRRLRRALARRAGPRVGSGRGLGQPREACRSARHEDASASTAPARRRSVAYRWKTQINENAKVPAFSAELPEADHNEIVGWEGARSSAASRAVFLEDSPASPRRAASRAHLARDRAGRGRNPALASRATTRLERVLSLVLLGDLVSIYLAVLRG